MSYPPCLCTWSVVGMGFVQVVTKRHVECPTHGDDSTWWERTQRRAKALGARIDGSDGA